MRGRESCDALVISASVIHFTVCVFFFVVLCTGINMNINMDIEYITLFCPGISTNININTEYIILFCPGTNILEYNIINTSCRWAQSSR